MRNKDGFSTIEEIYEEGTPVVRVFNTGLITVGGTYLHQYERKTIFTPLTNLSTTSFSIYKEVDVRSYAQASGFNPLKDWSWREIEEEADEWIKEIEGVLNDVSKTASV